MSGITKCTGILTEDMDVTCPMRETCWRYKAPSSSWQSYMHAPLYQLSPGTEWKCDEYWRADAD